MAQQQPPTDKKTPQELVTERALSSANPFQTPTPRPAALKGAQPIRQTPLTEARMPDVEPPDLDDEEDDELINPPEFADIGMGAPEAKPAEEEEAKEWIKCHRVDKTPEYQCEFAGRDIFIGLPWLKGSNPITALVLTALALDFGKDKIRFDVVMGDSMVYHARNLIADLFLKTDAKWLLMLDDDMIPSIGRPGWFRAWVPTAQTIPDMPLQRHVLQRLIGANKSLVGAAYFGRRENGRLMCSDLSLEQLAREYSDQVRPVEWVGTGCFLVHRKVFEDIAKMFPELGSKDPQIPFDYFRPTSHTIGEDVSFCRRAKMAGHQPHIDLGLPVKHVGFKAY